MNMPCWEELVDRQTGYLNFSPELNAKIAATPVAVIGAGGNGAVLDLLVRAGFTKFVIADPDIVEGTNLNRLPFGRDSIGLTKVAAWERYLKSVNPECSVLTHDQAITRHDGETVRELLSGTGIIFLGTTDVEANVVVGRTAARMGIRMVIGPASSGSCIVTTFTHDNPLNVETVARFGTENTPLEDIDYEALNPLYFKAMTFPGRAGNVTPEAWEGMRAGSLAARSCGIFVRLTNAVMAFEGIKNVAAMHGLPLERTGVVAMPQVQIFDPWSGAAYRFNVITGKIGLPGWPSGEIHWLD